MGTATSDIPATAASAFSVELESSTFAPEQRNHAEEATENLKNELLSLSVRQAEIRRRIHDVRHALESLVPVFGPEILAAAGKADISSRALSRSAPTMLDLVRMVLHRSHDSMTFSKVVDAVRAECPSVLSGFINPGAAVSNALRALHRRGEVELCNDQTEPTWKSVGNRKQSGRT